MKNNNRYTGRHLEFHILQSFPVSCLNRDDMGAPKSAVIGGVSRARVSSQCWKRAVRMKMHKSGYPDSWRTRYIHEVIENKCKNMGATTEQAEECGVITAHALTMGADKKKKKDKNEQGQQSEKLTLKNNHCDVLFFLSEREADAIVNTFKENGFKPLSNTIIQEKAKGVLNTKNDCIDIALFGRMVANAADLNVEAAASFAHAISIHEVNPEIDFFTAVDDWHLEEPGSGHMGSLEFNSATYYRYISLDLGQLAENMKTDDIAPAVEVFMKALFQAVPEARQTTMTAATPWDFAIVTLRKGQNLQIPFNAPVRKKRDTDMVSTGIAELKKRFEETKAFYGSLYGLEYQLEVGIGGNGFDQLSEGVQQALKA